MKNLNIETLIKNNIINIEVMKEEKNLYESPKLETMEIIVEQAILTASGDDAPDYGRGSDWEWN